MRVFNRIVMILLLAGLFVLGVYTVVYSFNLFGYSLENLPRALGLSGFYRGLETFVRGVESGSLSVLTVFILVSLAVLGLILLIAELKPPAPRRVRMRSGTYVTRGAVADEVVTAAEQTPNVLGTSARVKAKRRSGALVDLEARVRRGEDTGTIQSDLRRSVQERLGERGVPVSKLNVKLVEADPRATRTRVQ
ncbi:MAG: alkaline shock response membrane anchor protein AmaP [Actinobacteria bacterium]|nr:alkaline shock response membrane anchor protein AmaP [Actinomycetota bacterium]